MFALKDIIKSHPKFRKILQEEVGKYLNIQHEACISAYQSTCHFLKLKNGIPQSDASGVFVEINNEKFVFTAAHVVNDDATEICVGNNDSELLTLGGEWIYTHPDETDIAILKLSEETILKLNDNYQYINKNELGLNHDAFTWPFYAFVGFPATMSKTNKYNFESKGFTSRPLLYTTAGAPQKEYENLNYDYNTRIMCRYDKQNMKCARTGETKVGPDLFGISGCGLWYVPFQNDYDNIDKKLVAIMTDWPIKNRNFIVGTKIDVFVKILKEKGYNL